MAAEGFPVARIDEYAKPCEPAIHVLRSVVNPIEKHVNSNVTEKFVVMFFKGPRQQI